MSIRTIVTCNGKWPGRSCRASFLAHTGDPKTARALAQTTGWTQERNADYCAVCTHRRSKP